MRIAFFLLMLLISVPYGMLWANEEVEVPLSPNYEIPPLEAWEWRALEAEAKIIRMQAEKVLGQKAAQQSKLLESWKERYKLTDKDLEGLRIVSTEGGLMLQRK